jgi:hypothetical protein
MRADAALTLRHSPRADFPHSLSAGIRFDVAGTRRVMIDPSARPDGLQIVSAANRALARCAPLAEGLRRRSTDKSRAGGEPLGRGDVRPGGGWKHESRVCGAPEYPRSTETALRRPPPLGSRTGGSFDDRGQLPRAEPRRLPAKAPYAGTLRHEPSTTRSTPPDSRTRGALAMLPLQAGVAREQQFRPREPVGRLSRSV